MAHTPGLWTIERQVSRDGIVTQHITSQAAGTLGYGNVSESECAANARLWAAAPEMLEACKVALAESEAANDTSPSACHLRYVLRAAIAKAEGK